MPRMPVFGRSMVATSQPLAETGLAMLAHDGPRRCHRGGRPSGSLATPSCRSADGRR